MNLVSIFTLIRNEPTNHKQKRISERSAMNYALLVCVLGAMVAGCITIQTPASTPTLKSIAPKEEVLLPPMEYQRQPTICDPLRGEDQDVAEVMRGSAYTILQSSCI